MNTQRWAVVSRLLDEALDLPLEQRAAWLNGLRSSDPESAATVERMLDSPLNATCGGPGDLTVFEAALHAVGRPAQAADPQALPGRRLGAWQLETKIGEGGMGQVWLARRVDGLYEGQAAIKLLRDDVPLSLPQLSARFARERSALARLNHPNVAKLLDAGIDPVGGAYVVLEFVQGRLLAEHLVAACPSVASRVRLMVDIGAAVQHAHSQLIVHRDLKPGNVIVTADGAPKLLDFGVAALLDDSADRVASAPPHPEPSMRCTPSGLTEQVGHAMTVGYAAPEQFEGGPISAATDVYALGVMLFEMLSGGLPFAAEGRSRAQVAFDVLQRPPRTLGAAASAAPPRHRPVDPARIDADLEAVVMKSLQKRPADRYASVAELTADLGRWLSRRPVAAGNNDRRHRSLLWLRRNSLLAVLASCAALGLASAAAVGTWQWQRAQAAARTSESLADALVALLGSADAEQNGGAVPTVLEVLEKNGRELAQRLDDQPAAKARLFATLADVYDNMNRADLALPLARDWLATAARAFGEDDTKTLDAQLVLTTLEARIGPWSKVVAEAPALRQRVAKAYGERSEKMRGLLMYVADSHMELGQTEAAGELLREVQVLTQELYPQDDFEGVYLHRRIARLLSLQGRFREARQELRATEPAQRDPQPEDRRWVLALRRDTLALDVVLGIDDRIESRLGDLQRVGGRLLGPMNGVLMTLPDTLADYRTSLGDFRGAAAARAASLEGVGPQAGLPAALLARARRLWSACLAALETDEGVRSEIDAVSAAMRDAGTDLGTAGVETRLALARSALRIGDTALAGTLLATLHGAAAFQLDHDAWTASRVAQVEGELRRCLGDLAASRTLLQQRVAQLQSAGDTGLLMTWSALLDLACTLALLHDPTAAAVLAQAAGDRPPWLPPGHPLDTEQHRIAEWLHAPRTTPLPGDARSLVGIF